MADTGAIQNGSHSTPAMDNHIEAVNETEQSSSLLGQVILPQDNDWYNPFVIEGGVEQLAELNPFTIFQPGWSSFG